MPFYFEMFPVFDALVNRFFFFFIYTSLVTQV